MSIKILITAAAFSVLFFSCKSADNQVPALSADMCNCFKSIESSINPEMQSVFKGVAESSDPQSKMMDGMKTLSPEQAKEVGEQLRSVSSSKSAVGICMKELEKKYSNVYAKDKNAILEKIVNQLRSKDGCSVAAAILNLGLQKQKDR